jgi:hypothetical protein
MLAIYHQILLTQVAVRDVVLAKQLIEVVQFVAKHLGIVSILGCHSYRIAIGQGVWQRLQQHIASSDIAIAALV